MGNGIKYIRVSSEEQGKKFSLDAQDEELNNWFKKNNHNILKEFVDKSSGFNFDREDFQKMLDYIEDNYKEIDFIVYTEKDRLLRDVEIGGYLKYLCLSKNIQLISINEEIETEDNEAKEMFEIMMSAYAKLENKRKVRRTKRGKKTKFEKYKHHIAKAPFGYDMVEKNGIKIPQPNKDVITIQNIYDDYLKEGKNRLGYLKLAKKYNIKYKKKDKKTGEIIYGDFAVITIKNILHNPFYIGYICRTNKEKGRKEYRKGNHEPIIKEEIFFKIKSNEKWKDILNDTK